MFISTISNTLSFHHIVSEAVEMKPVQCLQNSMGFQVRPIKLHFTDPRAREIPAPMIDVGS